MASHLIDLGNTTQAATSIAPDFVLSGSARFPNSGAVIGNGVAMGNANSYCNMVVAGILGSGDGPLRVRIQTSADDVSGNYTDPTSGMTNLPTVFQSGGIMWINSGSDGGVFGAVVSGQNSFSGFVAAGAFVRPHLYARAMLMSGNATVFHGSVSFISQLRETGSGGGFTFSPGGGTVNV